MSFSEKYNKIKNIADKELKIIENKLLACVDIKEPLNSFILEFLKSPSKRVRPLLSILYLKCLNIDLTDKHFELLTSVELVHSASLVHDDIIDESELRRGVKTVCAEFGNKLGVISGDYLLSIAMEKIAKLNSVEILKRFSHTLKQMCIGEINQNYDRYKIISIEEYIEKSKNKTAYLFETAISSALLLSEIKDILHASEFGLNAGIAFQIRDDLLDFTDIDKSKPHNNDVKKGIYNAPIIYSGDVEDYRSGIENTKILLNNYVEKAFLSLSNLPDNIYKQTLIEFLELLKHE